MNPGDLVKYNYDDNGDIGIVIATYREDHSMHKYMVIVLWEDGKTERSPSHFLEVISESG